MQISLVLRAVDEASEIVRRVSQETSGALEEVRRASENIAQAHSLSWQETKNLITSFSGLATSCFALYSAIDRVQDAQINLSRASLLVQQATNALEEAQNRYNAAVAKYGEESPQAQAALRDLQLAQERYNYAVERAHLLQSNYNELVFQTAITFIPSLITAIDSGVKAFNAAKAAVEAAGGALSFLAANPIVIVVAAIAALISALIHLYNTNEGFRNAVNRLGETLATFFKPIVDTVIGALTWLWERVILPCAEAFRKFFDIITNNPILAALFGPITIIIYLIRNWEDITRSLQAVWDGFCRFLQWAYNTFVRPVVDGLRSLVDSVRGAVDAVKNTLGGFANAVQNAMEGAGQAISNFIKSICFAHAIREAVDSAERDLERFVDVVDESMNRAYGEIRGFNMNLGGLGMSVPAPPAAGALSVNINGPLVYVEGSADRRTAELAAELVREKLKTVVIEATSRSAPTKRIVIPRVM